MRQSVILIFIGLFFSISTLYATSGKGHRIELTISSLSNQDVILGYYYNKRMYVSDTARTDSKGVAVFQKEEPLPGGLYLFYLPNGKYFDVLIADEQQFSIKTDTIDFIAGMKISGSKESQLFLEYQRFINDKQKEANRLREALNAAGGDAAKAESINAQLEEINKQVQAYWKNVESQHNGTFFASFIKSMQEPEQPNFELPQGVQNADSLVQVKRYHFYRKYYFDNVDFTDERLLRTPFFTQKLETYFDRVIVQIPDTVTQASIEVIEKSRSNPEMFRYLVQFLFNRANESKIMGMDATMVALAEKYYLSGEAPWASEEFIKNLAERVRDIKPTLIGNLAHDLRMESINGEVFRLHEINAQVTVVVFYEPSCGHCKKELPKLYKTVFEPYRNKGVQVFAVYSMNDKNEWESFINEHELFDWINVYDPFHQTRFRNYYDIRSTPMIYVLDRHKKIAAKRLDTEQLPGFIDHLLSR